MALPPLIAESAYAASVQDAGVAQLVEHHVANVNVAGSNPVSRSLRSQSTRAASCLAHLALLHGLFVL
jgi:hypothetical protein